MEPTPDELKTPGIDPEDLSAQPAPDADEPGDPAPTDITVHEGDIVPDNIDKATE